MRIHIHRALQFGIGGKDFVMKFITLCLYSKAGRELFSSVCLGPIKFNLFVFIWFLYYPYSALSLSHTLTLIVLEGGGKISHAKQNFVKNAHIRTIIL